MYAAGPGKCYRLRLTAEAHNRKHIFIMNRVILQKRFILASLVAILAVFVFTGTSCRILKRDKQAIAEKKQEDANKKADAEYEKARKQHYANQNKETKKMMKQTKKDAARYNKPRKRNFYWLGVKCR